MISQWDIISRIDPKNQSRLYTLVTDGTEHDARLIAKKLAGYVQPPVPAVAPFVYAFELPADLDEDTLEKIRTAVAEGVEQTSKINQFVPGGVLGDPLFHAEGTQEEKDSPISRTTDSPASSLPTNEKPAPQKEPPTEPLQVERQTVATPEVSEPNAAGEITINDHDMLIKDMEDTLLGKEQVPLEDIFSAETKYDMFLDLDKQQLVKNPPAREQKMDAPQENKTESPQESFNIFEQKIKDQTCIIDLDDLNTITDRLAKKDMGFVQHANVPAETTPTAEKPVLPEPKADTPLPAQPAQTQPETNEPMEKALDPFEEFERAAQQSAAVPAETAKPVADTQAPSAAQPEESPLNLGPAPEETTVPTVGPDREGAGIIPEETALGNTIVPGSANSNDLPEITLRGNCLERTFNLETTLNTEVMKQQYEKLLHNTEPPAPAKPVAQPTGKLKRTMLRLLGKKKEAGQPPAPKQETSIHPGEIAMEENQEPKTTFRIRRKTEPTLPVPPAPAAPVPPVPAAPKAPAATQAPLPPAPQNTVSPKPAARPAAAQAANTVLEKTRTIDHSIEIPLSELKKHNWPLEVPLVPTYTLENMVMSVNRFAHATAISVIENPGKLYNPLVLHGTSGCGKTHFLNAMAYAFSKKYGQENIFMTNGVRLSRGIQRYVMEGNIEKFEKFMDTVKVLLIDDIHLLAINEQNRAHISGLLNKFLREQKQIVITSKYPPESLEKLEELIKFRLDSGWISELKPAAGNTHFKIVKKMLMDNGVDLTDAQIQTFFGGPHMTLGTVTRSIRRLKVLENLIFPHLPESQRSQATIFEKLLATTGEDETSDILNRDPDSITTISTVGNGEWGRVGFFYPQNSSHMMNWMVYALEQRAKELGIEGGFDIAVRSSYATENIISSAFKIANLCDNKKLKGAVILGPTINVCEPSVRENFYDILTHMLEIMLIRCGIINFEDAKSPSTYVKIISELLR